MFTTTNLNWWVDPGFQPSTVTKLPFWGDQPAEVSLPYRINPLSAPGLECPKAGCCSKALRKQGVFKSKVSKEKSVENDVYNIYIYPVGQADH